MVRYCQGRIPRLFNRLGAKTIAKFDAFILFFEELFSTFLFHDSAIAGENARNTVKTALDALESLGCLEAGTQ